MVEDRVFFLTNHGFCNCPWKGRGALSCYHLPAPYQLSCSLCRCNHGAGLARAGGHRVQLRIQPSSTCCSGREGSNTFSLFRTPTEPFRLASTGSVCWQGFLGPGVGLCSEFMFGSGCWEGGAGDRARAVHGAPWAAPPRTALWVCSGSARAQAQSFILYVTTGEEKLLGKAPAPCL